MLSKYEIIFFRPVNASKRRKVLIEKQAHDSCVALPSANISKPQPTTQRDEKVRGSSKGFEDGAGGGEKPHLLELWLHPLLAKPLMS
jgi:hypothetical protein